MHRWQTFVTGLETRKQPQKIKKKRREEKRRKVVLGNKINNNFVEDNKEYAKKI
jgi:hypothetical protein